MSTDAGNVAGARAELRAGVAYSVGAYTAWGLLPLYLRPLHGTPPFEILMHRMVWSALFVAAVLAIQRRWAWLRSALRRPAVWGAFAASALLLSVNWFMFVWAVSRGRIVDASLGYFINPLVSIALGALLLKERLSPALRVAVALAFLGVVWLTIQFGQLPWIGLALAASFGTYGLLRKVAALGAVEGLALETFMLLPVALASLGWLVAHGHSRFAAAGAPAVAKALTIGLGPVTAIPLLLFAAGARRIPLSLLGLLQYVGPTLQLITGVIVNHEPFGGRKVVGYALIWIGFLVASADGLLASRRQPRGPTGRLA